MLRPQSSQQQYQDLSIFREHVDSLIARLPENGEIVDLQSLFFCFTLDTTCEFLFREPTYTLRESQSVDSLMFAKAFDTAQDFVVKRFRLLDLYWLIGGSKFNRACDLVHRFIDNMITQQQAISDKTIDHCARYIFLNAFAEDSYYKEALRGQLLNILLADRDTTACLLSWTFYLLAHHPVVLSQLHAEIESIAGDAEDITRNDLKKMSYLAYIMKGSETYFCK